MAPTDSARPTRRGALLLGLAGVSAAALPVLANSREALMSEVPNPNSGGPRLPVVYLPHGGGPWPFVEMGMDAAENDELATYLRSIPALAAPKALLVISAHWEESVPTVMVAGAPPMLYDYYGFPQKAYEITWPAPGAPALAARVRALLGEAGVHTAEDSQRGFDHGAFVPLKVAWPEAAIPTLQLSLKAGLDPAEHLLIGRALAPLRDEGVLILGSGESFHNMRAFRDPRARPYAERFNAWLKETVLAPPAERDERLVAWAKAPDARLCHPREEHLLPLMVIAGAAGADLGSVPYNGTMMGMRHLAAHFG